MKSLQSTQSDVQTVSTGQHLQCVNQFNEAASTIVQNPRRNSNSQSVCCKFGTQKLSQVINTVTIHAVYSSGYCRLPYPFRMCPGLTGHLLCLQLPMIQLLMRFGNRDGPPTHHPFKFCIIPKLQKYNTNLLYHYWQILTGAGDPATAS